MSPSHLNRPSEYLEWIYLEWIYLSINVKIYFLVSQELKKLFGASKLIWVSAERTNIYSILNEIEAIP
jgi:uncharacterized HAD superfamily protein